MKTFFKNSTAGISPIKKWEPGSWIHVECPNETEKCYILDELGIPQSFFNDLEDIDERPRIELEDGWYLIVLRIPYRTHNPKLPFSTAPVGLIFNDQVFLSLCNVQTEMIPDFIQYSIRKNITFTNNFDLVLKLILSASVWFLKYLKQINQQIKTAENELEKSIKNDDLQTLLQIEKCLVYFSTSIRGNDILVNRIKNIKIHSDTLDPELLMDVEIEIKQAQETTNIFSDILSGMMDAYASVISNNLNIIMKQLTSISIILMIPTLIASLYGMNVPNTFQNYVWGFWIILAMSFGFSLLGAMIFFRKNWF